MSERTRVICGSGATKISDGWISPWYDSCANSLDINSFVPVDKYFEKAYEDKKTFI